MTTTSSSALLLTLLANLALSTAGCGVFGASDADKEATSDRALPERGEATGAEGPKAAPVVGGPADESELTEAFGVFVAPDGAANADGTRAHPVATIQAGIDLGKKVGKRVYVCTGTYREALTIADSISVIGGLDCSSGSAGWRTGAPRTRIESPTSPAIIARDIHAPTRLEGLDVLAPAASAPSGSSVGLLADHASNLVVALSRLEAGDAMNGEDGVEGVQLTTSSGATGGALVNAARCNSATCLLDLVTYRYVRPARTPGGINTCEGAPDHAADPGGAGGSGGLWRVVAQEANFHFDHYFADSSYGSDRGERTKSGAAGTDGADGHNGDSLGTLSAEGYVPANGVAGADGAAGQGGAGGEGAGPYVMHNPNTDPTIDGIWRGFNGAGGGAGGCAGLAGTAGTGGGASIALVALEGEVTIDTTELVSGRGGAAGRGALGSTPTSGGQPGPNGSSIPQTFAKPGGRGGAAGVSGNGSSGPSLGVAHRGPAPKIVGGTKFRLGAGGAGVDHRSRVDAFGIAKTIPATPAGLSKDILAL